MNNRTFKSYDVAITAILLAVILLLQCVLGAINIGAVSLSFVLIPIVLGAVAVNWRIGAFLGFCFGVITYIMGVTGLDKFTFLLVSDHPVLTAVVCIVKGTAAGLVAGLIFKPFKGKESKKEYAGLFVSSFAAPTVNTGLFILGALLMTDTLMTHPSITDFNNNVLYFLIIGCAGLNYILEVVLNMVFVPALFRVYNAVNKRNKG